MLANLSFQTLPILEVFLMRKERLEKDMIMKTKNVAEYNQF